MRLRKKLIRSIVVAGALIVASPFLALIGYGLYHGYDVLAAAETALTRREIGSTLDPSRVPFLDAPVQWIGHLEHPDIHEASGLAIGAGGSHLWVINDSGNAPELFAVSLTGELRARVRVRGADNRDWEDLGAFVQDKRPYLVVGDVGDNLGWRPELQLYVVEEPRLADLEGGGIAVIEPRWTVRFRYPDVHRDCEALAVDETTQSVLLISKRTVPAEVWRVPLRPGRGERVVVAEKVAALSGIPQPTEHDRRLDETMWKGNAMPTGLDIAGERAVVLSYLDAYVFDRQPGESWPAALGRIPRRVALPGLRGREAAALSQDGRDLYVTGERDDTRPASLFRVHLGEAPSELTRRSPAPAGSAADAR